MYLTVVFSNAAVTIFHSGCRVLICVVQRLIFLPSITLNFGVALNNALDCRAKGLLLEHNQFKSINTT